MGKYSASAEEDEIVQVLRGAKDFEETVPAVEQSQGGDDIMDLLLGLSDEQPEPTVAQPEEEPVVDLDHPGLFQSSSDFLLAGLEQIYTEPERSPETGGVNLQVERSASDAVQTIALTPSDDLRQRLQALPQSYLAERGVLEKIRLTPERGIAERRLRAALSDPGEFVAGYPLSRSLAPDPGLGIGPVLGRVGAGRGVCDSGRRRQSDGSDDDHHDQQARGKHHGGLQRRRIPGGLAFVAVL